SPSTGSAIPASRIPLDALRAIVADLKSRQELETLSQERDPELFFEGLLAFGTRQEQAGNTELAARVYAAIVSHGGAGSEGGPASQSLMTLESSHQLSYPNDSIRSRAQSRLNAILGQGGFGP